MQGNILLSIVCNVFYNFRNNLRLNSGTNKITYGFAGILSNIHSYNITLIINTEVHGSVVMPVQHS
ncbi:MAG: hypothetical protein A3208_04865 [Candidatus Methanoprimaticola hominis]|nr:MAG: hypothetical protein A3208_04865 [Methanomassiliicoccales archaeon Mx-06]